MAKVHYDSLVKQLQEVVTDVKSETAKTVTQYIRRKAIDYAPMGKAGSGSIDEHYEPGVLKKSIKSQKLNNTNYRVYIDDIMTRLNSGNNFPYENAVIYGRKAISKPYPLKFQINYQPVHTNNVRATKPNNFLLKAKEASDIHYAFGVPIRKVTK